MQGMPSALLVGKNGTGKSTLAAVLEVLQRIARGTNRVGMLVNSRDFTRERSEVPIRFELEVLLDNRMFKYVLALELPETFKDLRVSEEHLIVAGDPIYSRKEAQVTLYRSSQNREAQFLVDWHLVALPVIQEQSETDPLHQFKTWLARSIILAPIPSLMSGDSRGGTLEPNRDCSNFADWFYGLLSRYPAAYTLVEQYLREVMTDLRDFLNEPTGKDSRSMIVRFERDKANLSQYLSELSDGEKCFFLCAVLVAANKFYGPLFCFWDEPDNYLSLSEVGHFLVALRRSFEDGGQLVATSHNPEAIRKFSDENTFILYRRSHLQPTRVKLLNEMSVTGDLVDALIRDDVEP